MFDLDWSTPGLSSLPDLFIELLLELGLFLVELHNSVLSYQLIKQTPNIGSLFYDKCFVITALLILEAFDLILFRFLLNPEISFSVKFIFESISY